MVEERPQVVARAVEKKGLDPRGTRPFPVGRRGIPDMEDLPRRQAEPPESLPENRRGRLAGTGIGGGENELERQIQPFKDAVEAAVEIRHHGHPETFPAGPREHLRDLGKDPPGRRLGIVGEERFEAVVEQIFRKRLPGGTAEGETDDPPPPCPLGRIALRVILPGGIAAGGKGLAESLADRRGLQPQPRRRRMAGVNPGHRLGGLDQGAGGIEQKGADHGSEDARPAAFAKTAPCPPRGAPPCCRAMKRRNWISLTVAAGVSQGCRKAPVPAPPEEAAWSPLDDAWQHVMGGEFTRPEPGVLRLQWGEALSAIRWTGTPPAPPFEIELEARRLDGSDFFCGLTFPARPSGECLTWVVGGWGGGTVGLSSIDGRDAADNETTTRHAFEKDRWYHLRLRRANERVEAWIDGGRVIDLDTTGRALSLRPGPIAVCAPFGLATWQSSGEFKALQWRPVRA